MVAVVGPEGQVLIEPYSEDVNDEDVNDEDVSDEDEIPVAPRSTYGGSFGGPEHRMPDAPVTAPGGRYVEAPGDDQFIQSTTSPNAGVLFEPPPAPRHEPVLTHPRVAVHTRLQAFIQKVMGADEQTLIRWNPESGTVTPDASPDFFNIQVNILDLMDIPGSGFEWLPLYLQSTWGKFLREGRKRITMCVDALSDVAKAEAQAQEDCSKALITHEDLNAKLADWGVERMKLKATIVLVNKKMEEVSARMVPYSPNEVPTAALVAHLENG